jgi:hypothetical protein
MEPKIEIPQTSEDLSNVTPPEATPPLGLELPTPVSPQDQPPQADSPWTDKEAYKTPEAGWAGNPTSNQVEPALPEAGREAHGISYHLGRKAAVAAVAALALVGIGERSNIIDQFNKPSTSSEYNGNLVPPDPSIRIETPVAPVIEAKPPVAGRTPEQGHQVVVKKTETPNTLPEPKPPTTRQEDVTPPSSKPEQPPVIGTAPNQPPKLSDSGGTETKPTDGKVHNPIEVISGSPPIAPPVESPVTSNPPPLKPEG